MCNSASIQHISVILYLDIYPRHFALHFLQVRILERSFTNMSPSFRHRIVIVIADSYYLDVFTPLHEQNTAKMIISTSTQFFPLAKSPLTNTTKTATYAAMAPKISPLLALVTNANVAVRSRVKSTIKPIVVTGLSFKTLYKLSKQRSQCVPFVH